MGVRRRRPYFDNGEWGSRRGVEGRCPETDFEPLLFNFSVV